MRISDPGIRINIRYHTPRTPHQGIYTLPPPLRLLPKHPRYRISLLFLDNLERLEPVLLERPQF